MNHRLTMWLRALRIAAAAAGLSIAVNLATELKHSWIAWIAVGVITVLSAAFSLSSQTRSTSNAREAVAEDRQEGKSAWNTSGIVFQSDTIQGTVTLNQVGKHSAKTQLATLVVLVAIAFFLFNGWSPTQQTAATRETANSSPAITTPSGAKDPLRVTTSWPLTRGCDGGTMIAMPAGGPLVGTFRFDGHERNNMIDAGGGSWAKGALYVTLDADGATKVTITNLRPIIEPRRLAPPAWVYSQGGGCGGPSNRVFELNLDAPYLRDRGIVEGTARLDENSRTEPIGPQFTVSKEETALLRFDTQSCRGNYAWSLEISYVESGHDGTRTKVVGPFRSLGFGEKTKLYTPNSTRTGYVKEDEINGFPKFGGCPPE